MANLRISALSLVGVMGVACSGTIGDGATGPLQDPTAPQASTGAPNGVNPDPVVGDPQGPVSTVGPDGTTPVAPGTTDPATPCAVGSPPLDLIGEPYYARAVPLTNEQWTNTVQEILNLESPPTQASSFIKPSGGFTLFPNNERVLEVTNSLRESYTLAAEELAVDLLASPGAIDRIGAGNDADTFISTFGLRAFRRPLDDAERSRYRELYDIGAALSGDGTEFEKGASIVVEAMLQSPHFIYRSELSPNGAALTSYEIASKLSFWLLNRTPSDTLLERAAQSEFDSAAGVAALASELADDPAAADTAVSMFAEMFKFVRYGTIVKGVPEYDPAMGAEADEVSRRFFANVYEKGQGLRDVLLSTEGFVGPSLAPLYNMTTASLDAPIDLGPQRVGFFSQVPYLMLFGSDGQSDAIHRGLFINYQVLCAQLPRPNFDLPEPGAVDPTKTDRERTESLTGWGTCGEVCHGNFINPLGYAFENYDGLGRWRDVDNGKPVDSASAYPFPEGTLEFNGAAELMQILANSQRSHQCFAKNIASFGLQRDIIASDQQLLDSLASISMSPEGSMKNLIVELAESPEFRTREGAAL